MSERFSQLAARHQALLARCAAQRQDFGSAALEVEEQLGRVDRAIGFVRNLARHPAVIAGAIGLIACVGPRRLLSWGSRGLMFYSMGRQLVGRTLARREIVGLKSDLQLDPRHQDSPRIRRSSSEA